ncbi:MAG: hypothetical protein Q9212_004086 [Teloschistes hypoglaucus]
MTARLERVLSVENHTSRPITSVTVMQAKTIHEWILSQLRLLLRTSPGTEVTKVRKIKPASARAPLHNHVRPTNSRKAARGGGLTIEGDKKSTGGCK